MTLTIRAGSLWRSKKEDLSGVTIYSNSEVPPYVDSTPSEDDNFQGYPPGFSDRLAQLLSGALFNLQNEGGPVPIYVGRLGDFSHFMPYLIHHRLIDVEFNDRGLPTHISITPYGSQVVSDYYKGTEVYNDLAVFNTVTIGQVVRVSVKRLKNRVVVRYVITLLYRDSSQQIHSITTINTHTITSYRGAFFFSYRANIAIDGGWQKELDQLRKLVPVEVYNHKRVEIINKLTPIIDGDVRDILRT